MKNILLFIWAVTFVCPPFLRAASSYEGACENCTLLNVDLKIVVQPATQGTASALPKADFLVLTWTNAETDALSFVLGGGKYFFHDLKSGDFNFNKLVIPGMALPAGADCEGYFFSAAIDGKSVVFFRSNFHPKLNAAASKAFFQNILGPATRPNFKTLITSGTGGGVWAKLDVGDVVVTNAARFGLTLPQSLQSLTPFTGVSNIAGSNPPSGYPTWYGYVNAEILQKSTSIINGLQKSGGRNPSNPPPSIYYTGSGTDLTDVISNSKISTDEHDKRSYYQTLGAMFDENDAFVADACNEIGFSNWVSIRNVSDLPGQLTQYDQFGYCSSLDGAYAIWAYIEGH
jgi:hypothetical protein